MIKGIWQATASETDKPYVSKWLALTKQADKEIIATSELIFNEFPISLGSKILPTITCTAPTQTRMLIKGKKFPNWSNENIAGKVVPINEPMVGIKLRITIKNDQNSGESMPINSKIT